MAKAKMEKKPANEWQRHNRLPKKAADEVERIYIEMGGTNIRAVARATGRSWNTVKKIVEERGLKNRIKRQQTKEAEIIDDRLSREGAEQKIAMINAVFEMAGTSAQAHIALWNEIQELEAKIKNSEKIISEATKLPRKKLSKSMTSNVDHANKEINGLKEQHTELLDKYRKQIPPREIRELYAFGMDLSDPDNLSTQQTREIIRGIIRAVMKRCTEEQQFEMVQDITELLQNVSDARKLI